MHINNQIKLAETNKFNANREVTITLYKEDYSQESWNYYIHDLNLDIHDTSNLSQIEIKVSSIKYIK